jgi:predicted ester cyclase
MPVRLPEGSAGALTAGQRRALEAFYAVLNDHDVDLLDQAAAPDREDIPPAPGQGSGPADAKPIFRMLLSALPDFSVEILEVVAGPGRAAVRATARGTHRGALFGAAATGRQVSLALHEFHQFEGNRCAAPGIWRTCSASSPRSAHGRSCPTRPRRHRPAYRRNAEAGSAGLFRSAGSRNLPRTSKASLPT